MVKSVLGVNHQGVRDWVIQRVSAILMAVYFVGLMGYVIMTPGISFPEWHHLFSQIGMKIATLVVISLLLAHAWIGIWTVFTDYVKPYVLRVILNFFVLLILGACFFWTLLILGSV